MTLAEVQAARQRLLVHPRRRRHAGPAGGGLPVPGPRRDRPGLPGRHAAGGARAVPGVVLNLDIKQTAPAVAPYEAALADLLAEFGRTDDVIVASFLDPATDAFRAVAPDVAVSAGTLATAEFWRAVQAGVAPAAAAGGRVPGTRAPRRPGGRRRALRRRPPIGPASPSTCGRSTTATTWRGWSTSAWTGSSPTYRPRWSASSTPTASPGRAWPEPLGPGEMGLTKWGLSVGAEGQPTGPEPRSAAPAVRLLAVVGLLLRPQLALHRPLRHKTGQPRSTDVASGDVEDRVRTGLAPARRGRAGVARTWPRAWPTGPGGCSAGRTTRRRCSCPGPVRSTPRGCGSPIDVAFFDRDLTVLATVAPDTRGGWPLPRPGARSVLASSAGSFERWGLSPGDRLEIRETS